MSDATPSGISDAERNWFPIATAPKDGTPVLLWRARAPYSNKLIIGYWIDSVGWHTPEPHWRISEAAVTHWMPLPEGPKE